MSKITMVKAKIDKEYLMTAEGDLFNSKYDLFDAIFGGITADYKITVSRGGKEYQKTCIKPTLTKHLFKQIEKYCKLDELHGGYAIEEVYYEKLAG